MNLDLVEQIVVLLSEYPVSEISVEVENRRVHAAKPLGSALPVLIPAPEASADAVAEEAEVIVPEARILTAPMVGIFHHTEPPLSFGADIKIGQVIGSIESMKLMNEVTAEEGGRLTDILVEDGAPVDYGRALFQLAAL